jgi:hypothetical protein
MSKKIHILKKLSIVYFVTYFILETFFLPTSLIISVLVFETGPGNSILLFTWHGSLVEPEGASA